MQKKKAYIRNTFLSFSLFCAKVSAATPTLDLTDSFTGYFSLFIFFIAYLMVMGEETLQLRKSKPVLVAAGIIWGMIAWTYASQGLTTEAEETFRHNLLEYAELLLFLLVAMTYINAMEERRLFDALRAWMVNKGFSLKTIFWLSGILAFFISPIADNLTTALLMCAVVMKVGRDDRKFVSLCCINIVICANAGGAFSPFGDITTLMVWQKGVVHFEQFFVLFIPSVVNALVPAVIMSFQVENKQPQACCEKVIIKRGAFRILGLFLLTITLAVCAHSILHMPPVLGMMTGLGLLQFFGYFLRKTLACSLAKKRAKAEQAHDMIQLKYLGSVVSFDVFNRVAKAECAIVDNIPVMFAVLKMQPDMSLGQWLLVTLTAGVGGSLLSIGSAAGVAVMGQARGIYTFTSHLKWTPVIALGYIASIFTHLWLNSSSF